MLIITSLIKINSQTKVDDFKHWNLTVAGGITWHKSDKGLNLCDRDTIPLTLHTEMEYFEFRIGYKITHLHEINFSIKEQNYAFEFYNTKNLFSGDTLIGTSTRMGEILHYFTCFNLGYRYNFPGVNNYYLGIDFGWIEQNYLEETRYVFNIETGLKKMIYKNLFFISSINYSGRIPNFLFQRIYSNQVRINLGLNLNL